VPIGINFLFLQPVKRMKYINFWILILVVSMLQACGNSGERNLSTDVINNPNSATEGTGAGLPVIEFEKDIHDFGKLIAGEKAVVGFKFTNTGDEDLVISQVKSSCGCTVPRYPKEAIKPGEGGTIKVTFDSSGRKGMQNKAITIVSNCQPNNTVVRIKAQVISP
jgi:hypothetical protein